MAIPTLVELAEAGAHFGHHRSLTYPKAKGFVYAIKSDVALINLEQTQSALENAQQLFARAKAEGKIVLFVGTKRSVRGTVKEVAEAVDCPYITERWFGGMLTNFATMGENIKKMNKLEEYLAGDKAKKLSKLERLELRRKLERSERFLSGVKNLTAMPDLIILASASEDKIAIKEANHLGIPVISITDTDMNPDFVTYPIPANDDAPKAVELILNTIIAKPTTKTSKKEEVSEETETVEEEKPKKAAAKETTTKKTTAKAKKEA